MKKKPCTCCLVRACSPWRVIGISSPQATSSVFRTVTHSISNDGTEALVCLVIGQRLDQDVADYPNQHKCLYRNNGAWNLVDMGNIRVLRELTQEP